MSPQERCATYSHEWRHLDAKKYSFPKEFNTTHYIRIDNFYCCHCPEFSTRRREEKAEKQPDWF